VLGNLFHYKLALRYLRGRHKLLFTFPNLLSLLGIIIGVFSLLVVSSVMNGMAADMQQRVLASQAEIKVYQKNYEPIQNSSELIQKIEQNESVKAASAVNEMELLLQNKNSITSTVCYGIDLHKHNQITGLNDKMRIGAPDVTSFQNGIIMGLDMSLTLNVTVGEYVRVTSPVGKRATPFGLLPKTKKLKVVGIFISGLPQYDRAISYVSLQNSHFFSETAGVSQIEVKTKDGISSQKVDKQLQRSLGENYVVEDWSEFEANLFNAIKMEKAVMFIVLALMILLAAFNMSGNYIKLVAEKRVEIGVLKAMGASDRDVVKIFVNIGAIIGILGTLIGLFLAGVVIFLQAKFQIVQIPVSGFPMAGLPVAVRWSDFVLVPVIAIIISFLATLNPAGKTAKIDPIKTIRDN
jgi:lipoprotein-releasing system permease protein